MRHNYSKGQLNQALAQERELMRVKHKESRFLRRSSSIYHAQVRRADKLKRGLSYSLEEFRAWMRSALRGECPYCRCKLTLAKISPDHRHPIARGGEFLLDNLDGVCQSCNWQKGAMAASEFAELTAFLDEHFEVATIADIKRRLTIGGKWAGKMFHGN